MRDLAVLIPTRGRPDNVRKVISAWDFTNAWDDADMVLVADADDPEIQGYRDVVAETDHPDTGEPLVRLIEMTEWTPMVHKLNAVARELATGGTTFAPSPYWALAFAGDDHLPQTINWAKRYLTVLHELGSGMVYGDDGYHGVKLSTEWAVTSDAVRALGRMVPAPVEHLYCDDAMMDLYGGARALRHLPEVRIEHFNPYAGGKAPMDDQYRRVNGTAQYKRDRAAYEGWKSSGMASDVATVRRLRTGLEPVAAPMRPSTSSRSRTTPMRSGPTQKRIAEMTRNRFPFSTEFQNVRGATPDEIGMTLADFATQVPADQEIVELGVFQGRTALILAWGAAQGHGAHVTGIDPWDLEGNVYDPPFTEPESREWALYRIRELGYADRITLVQNFSHEVARERTEVGGEHRAKVGLLFVDGDHTKEGARQDIEAWAPHLAEGAIIAIDDYGHPDWPGVAQAVDELVTEGVLEPVDVYHDRLAVTRLVTGPKGWDDPDSDPVGDTVRATQQMKTITAITSEGVSPLPEAPVATEPGCTHPDCILDHPHAGPAELALDGDDMFAGPDTHVSNDEPPLRATVHEDELAGVAEGTPIEELTIPQMKTLARRRNIVLGIRKDKRELIVQALIEGK